MGARGVLAVVAVVAVAKAAVADEPRRGFFLDAAAGAGLSLGSHNSAVLYTPSRSGRGAMPPIRRAARAEASCGEETSERGSVFEAFLRAARWPTVFEIQCRNRKNRGRPLALALGSRAAAGGGSGCSRVSRHRDDFHPTPPPPSREITRADARMGRYRIEAAPDVASVAANWSRR
jgi:hypothetical protein